jgi:hypothetical protein
VAARPPTPREEERKDKQEQEVDEKAETSDWRSVLRRLNTQVKQVEELPKVAAATQPPDPPKLTAVDDSDDCLDIVLKCRRARVMEQCARLQPRVVLSDKVPGNTNANGNPKL